MGRPIKKKFFGSLTTPYQNQATGGRTGVGAEGIASIAVANTLTNAGYSTSTTVTWVASAPQTAGGVPASGTATVLYVPGLANAGMAQPGRITALTVTDAGTGYSSTATVTLTFSPARVAGTATTFAAVLSTGRQNAIAFISYLTTGSSAVANGDILKQEASKRYLVQNAQGQGQCKLVASPTLAAGQMNIIATDANGSTYFVKKLTARKAVVAQSTVSTAFLVGDGVSTGWTLDAASGTIVSITDTI
jgi:hypothetical protein